MTTQFQKPRLYLLRKSAQQVIKAKGKKAKDEAKEDFYSLNDEGWQTCAVGAFLNDCGVNVREMAICRGTSNGEVVRKLVDREVIAQGEDFEHNVCSKKPVEQKKAISLLNKLIRSKPCSILRF